MSGFDQFRQLQELKRAAKRENFDTVNSAPVGCQLDWTDGDDKLTLTIYGKLTLEDICTIIEFKAKMDKRPVVNQPR
ncbi:hypothetical protein LOE09_08230 [Pseudosulfitobacter pseudonitzschiae]|uniref:hypothetical protein n=1 Tax=Pseudosulfitobacter pseudonitzschiae TaxID=1402135 RepID=UPI001AF5E31A|nr:hypothetical protein [Pseudosulfitobacter pseudonitzschiae]MBM1909412.1 hypothetical protein [Pseudosulfitobacter pseudonitzschiae]MBM1938514.1 hypothetical protein [Pseudosulfitobacter pseudonitzschiae]MBM1957896.1 hypothetical protein [Pseudosulfitobacter pseudonitzschiae]MBM1990830.1 hypothetical protein [Pseudosulfitobacter pseudonitzschiae]MBM2093489.1 hypothetical protein [Pseudosulfitobacter pseudonitzschiae]